jgi:hypothetical protein
MLKIKLDNIQLLLLTYAAKSAIIKYRLRKESKYERVDDERRI